MLAQILIGGADGSGALFGGRHLPVRRKNIPVPGEKAPCYLNLSESLNGSPRSPRRSRPGGSGGFRSSLRDAREPQDPLLFKLLPVSLSQNIGFCYSGYTKSAGARASA